MSTKIVTILRNDIQLYIYIIYNTTYYVQVFPHTIDIYIYNNILDYIFIYFYTQ